MTDIPSGQPRLLTLQELAPLEYDELVHRSAPDPTTREKIERLYAQVDETRNPLTSHDMDAVNELADVIRARDTWLERVQEAHGGQVEIRGDELVVNGADKMGFASAAGIDSSNGVSVKPHDLVTLEQEGHALAEDLVKKYAVLAREVERVADHWNELPDIRLGNG